MHQLNWWCKMNYYLNKYSLGDILNLASNNESMKKVITYGECAELLELRLSEKHPWIDPEMIYNKARSLSNNTQEYCHRLVDLGARLNNLNTYNNRLLKNQDVSYRI